MKGFLVNKKMIIGDLSGTFVDLYGTSTKLAFKETCYSIGVNVSPKDIAMHMGMNKLKHLSNLIEMHGCSADGTAFTQDMLKILHDNTFVPILHEHIKRIKPIRGVIDTLNWFKERSGGCVGYTSAYSQTHEEIIQQKLLDYGLKLNFGYTSEMLDCKDRPSADMINRAMATYNMNKNQVIKIGDTESDMAEGANAGVFTIGVWGTSAYRSNSYNYDNDDEKIITKKLRDAGADVVLYSVNDLRDYF